MIAGLLLPFWTLCAQTAARPVILYQNQELEAGQQLPPSAIFLECTFHNAGKPVLGKADGAVFLGCSFICDADSLFLARSGDGIVMAGCRVIGAQSVGWSEEVKESDRNYLYDFTICGQNEPELYGCQQTVDMEGLRLADAFVYETENGDICYNLANLLNRPELDVTLNSAEQYLGRSLKGLPVRMTVCASEQGIECGSGQVVTVCAGGLDADMFIGWTVSDERLVLAPSADPASCTVSLKDGVDDTFSAVVTAYTEYGLEQAVSIDVSMKPAPVPQSGKKVRKGLFRRRKK